ncbi:hypothetical protein D9M71_802840 [compost metagenome]
MKSSSSIRSMICWSLKCASNRRPDAVHGIGAFSPMSEEIRKCRSPSFINATVYLRPLSRHICAVSRVWRTISCKAWSASRVRSKWRKCACPRKYN